MEQEKTQIINQDVKLHIPTSITKKEFLKAALDKMEDYSMPLDAYDEINVAKIQKYLVPAYIFKGEVEAQWSCKYATTSTITINKQKNEIKPGSPLTGSFSDVEFECVMTSPESDMKWANNFNAVLKPEDVVEINNDALNEDDTIIMKFPKNGEAIWNKSGNNATDFLSIAHATNLISDPMMLYAALGLISQADASQFAGGMGMPKQKPAVCDWDVFSRSKLTSEPKEVYVPVWCLSFEYKGEEYYAAAPAIINGPISVFSPQNSLDGYSDEMNKMVTDATNIQNKIKYAKHAGWLAILVFFVSSLLGAIIYLGIWYGALTFLKHKYKSLISQASDKLNLDTEKAHSKIMNSL